MRATQIPTPSPDGSPSPPFSQNQQSEASEILPRAQMPGIRMFGRLEASLYLPLLSRATNSSYHYHHPGFLVNKKMTPTSSEHPMRLILFCAGRKKRAGLLGQPLFSYHDRLILSRYFVFVRSASPFIPKK